MVRKIFALGAALVALLVLLWVTGAVVAGPPLEGPEGDVSIAATVGSKISYQGVLKESGSLVTGSPAMTFRLYSDAACTTQVGSDIVKSSVQVTDGLFSVDLAVTHSHFNGQGLWLEVEVGGTKIGCQEILPVPYALSLRPGARVVGEQTGWNAIYASNTATTGSSYGVRGTSYSPDGRGITGENYATSGVAYGVCGLTDSTAGRGVYGRVSATSGTNYGVYGKNSSSDGYGGYFTNIATSGYAYGVCGLTDSTAGRGVYGRVSATSGTNYGVYGKSSSSDGYGGYFTNIGGGVDIMAAGSGIIKSTADTEIAVSPLKMVAYHGSNVDLLPVEAGFMVVQPNATGLHYVYVPVDLPSVLFGTATKLKSVRICYICDTAASYIDHTRVRYVYDNGGSTDLISDSTDRKADVWWDCYTLTDTTPDEIQGSLFVRFSLNFGGTGSAHEIYIGRITLTLTE